MTDQKKTKAELISELVKLREEVAELKESEAKCKQAEAELRESEAKYRALVDNLPAITYIAALDSNSTTLYVSPQIKNILGVSTSDFKADPDLWRKMLHPEDRERVIAEVSHCHSKREPFTVEYRMIVKGGQEIYIYDDAWIVEDENGKPLYSQGVMHDITKRKQAEEAQRESEKKYRLLFETAKDAIFMSDESGEFIDVNQAACESLGYSKEEFMELTIKDIDANPEGYEQFVKVRNGRAKNATFEVHQRRKDGTVLPVEVSGAFFVSNGQRMSLAIVRDISEYKKAEKALRESEARFRELFNNMPIGVAIYTAVDKGTDFVFKDYNPAGTSIDHIKREAAIGRRVTEVCPGITEFGLLDVLRRVWKTGEQEHLPVSIYKDKKIERWRENSVYKLPSGEIVAVYTDETERMEAEEAMRESEQKYRLLFETAKDAIFMSDENGKFIDVNQAACESLGYSKEEFMELAIKDIDVHPEGYEQFIKARNGRSKSAKFEVNQRRKDGTVFPVEINGTVFVSDGQTMSLAAARNISDRRKVEEKIKAYQEQLRSLASEMSSAEDRQRCQFAADLHDNIGQLLAVTNIKLGSARKIAPPGEMAELLDEINELVVKAFHCTQSLTHELYPPILYKFGLDPAVEWLLENLEKEHGIAYRFETKGKSKTLDNDISSLLFRAVRELLINIVKHAKADEVRVSIRKRGEQIKISVEDNGVGFDTSQLKPVSKQARGFGLFSLRERLSYQGGKLDIESDIGRGTRVTITAPLTKAH